MTTATRPSATVLSAVISVIMACSANDPIGHVQSSLPGHFDVPDPAGNKDVHTPYHPKCLTSPCASEPSDPYFCYLVKITGPFAEGSDAHLYVDNDGYWAGKVTNSESIRIGCSPFADLTNAGNATAEGLTVFYSVSNTGVANGFGTSITIPGTPLRNPDFCPLSGVAGHFLNDNCDSYPSARSWSNGYPNNDAYQLVAQGSHCYDWAGSSTSTIVTASAACETKWSGLAHVKLAANNVASTTTGAALIPTSNGVCWISKVDRRMGNAGAGNAETVEIYDNNGTWTIRSTTNGSGNAACILYNQQ